MKERRKMVSSQKEDVFEIREFHKDITEDTRERSKELGYTL